MPNYSNEASLKATFGDSEVSGLLVDAPGVEDQARLDKAANAASAEIDVYLRTAGYLLPLTFSQYGATLQDGDPPFLDAKLQAVADHFTAWHLASSTDLSKKKYEDLRAQDLQWLEDVRLRKVRLDLEMTATVTGAGQVTTVARPRVFTSYLLDPDTAFPVYKK